MKKIDVYFALRLVLGLFFMTSIVISCSSVDDDDMPVYGAPDSLHLETPLYYGNKFNTPDDNYTTVQGVALGRRLFYDKILSRNQTISCASCHQQDKAFTDGLANSVGIDGQQVGISSMAIQNMLWTGNLFWNGRSPSLEDQALKPISNPKEMDLPIVEAIDRLKADDVYVDLFAQAFPDEGINPTTLAKAIAQFERTLISDNAKLDRYFRGEDTLTLSELRGRTLFNVHPNPLINARGANCVDCHVGNMQMGTPNEFFGFMNNGLEPDASLEDGLMEVTGDPEHRGKFRAPSLRNIALTAPYMHDGRFATLAEVVTHYNENIQISSTLDPLIIEATNDINQPDGAVYLDLTEEEKQDIINYLHTLTDEEFINNPDFSSPF